ncbi:OsmC family protein [Soehngenia longivitae]|uniref:OsmC family protein n=1 Tax=Soehngenia longivitae TaxID=2562294 RepID=UPI001ADE8917|nr:OsmC family protein [Soehngenia longivitae]
MKEVEVVGNLIGNTAYKMNIDGHDIIIDTSVENGGNDLGPRPKALMLASLIGCTGIDVKMILDKMKVKIDDIQIKVRATATEEHPKVYTSFHVIYEFKGTDLDIRKIEKAVKLSQEKYCGVTAMLRMIGPVTHEIVIRNI